MIPMQILLAIDSFKGCLSSEEVEAAFSQALTARGAKVRSLPMSDGGEGMLPAFITALHGQLFETEVHDPLMRPITASYSLTPDGTAVIETAQACGLTRLSAEERNPLVATTYGVGELVAHAFLQGARRFIIGLGGSGTSDAGKGMLQGLTDSLAPGGMTEDILNGPLAGCSFVLASDVRNPLYGPEGAAHIFAPQKGATPEWWKNSTAVPASLPKNLPAAWARILLPDPVPEQPEDWDMHSFNTFRPPHNQEPIFCLICPVSTACWQIPTS